MSKQAFRAATKRKADLLIPFYLDPPQARRCHRKVAAVPFAEVVIVLARLCGCEVHNFQGIHTSKHPWNQDYCLGSVQPAKMSTRRNPILTMNTAKVPVVADSGSKQVHNK